MTKNNDKLTICHLILMCIVGVLSCVSAGMIFSGYIPEGYATVAEARRASIINGMGHVVNVLALICGIVYILKGSGKKAALFYDVFLLLVTLGLALRLAGRLFHHGFDVAVGLMIGSVIILLILTFVKDLGRMNTWYLFLVLVVLDLIAAILLFDSREAFPTITSGLTRLVLDGAIGLAIRAKYIDKATRGK